MTSDVIKVLLGALLGGTVLALLLVGGFSGSGMGYGMMGGLGHMMSGVIMGSGLFWVLFVLIFWVLLVASLVSMRIIVWVSNAAQRH